jgi:ABC-type molybdate transport system substrate-binding protein
MPRELLVALALEAMTASAAAQTVRLHAAGSLRTALVEMSAAFEKTYGVKVEATFGASGRLRDEIAAGAPAEVFASANMEHPQALAKIGRSGPVVLFARNQMCVLARRELGLDATNLLARMLDPQVKLATSTPIADPAGDYAWEVFRKAEALMPGAFKALEAKALQMVGGPASPAVPPGRSAYGVIIAEGKADMFLTYCTNALAAVAENASQHMMALPAKLAVGADYGLTVMASASPQAYRFAMFILSAQGQRILLKHGFAAPTAPE